ncbi:MAG: hypothetical protein QM704_02225 [Anaeromyxobacteraceae bacterium]
METEKTAAEFRERCGGRPTRRGAVVPGRAPEVYFLRRRAADAPVAAISRELAVKRHTLMTWLETPTVPGPPGRRYVLGFQLTY